MIYTSEDVVDAEQEIGLRHLDRGLSSDDKLRRSRRQPDDLGRASAILDASKRVSETRAQPIYGYLVPFDPSRAYHAPSFEVGSGLDRARGLILRLAGVRKADIQTKAHVAYGPVPSIQLRTRRRPSRA